MTIVPAGDYLTKTSRKKIYLLSYMGLSLFTNGLLEPGQSSSEIKHDITKEKPDAFLSYGKNQQGEPLGSPIGLGVE
jgi:hypothetical protein